MNTRWTLDEEKLLIKSIKSGESLDKLAKELDRSENALELRIKKIIYDNIAAEKPISTLSRNLNMSSDKIKQYFYSYKDMMDKKGKTTVDIKEDIHSNNDNSDRGDRGDRGDREDKRNKYDNNDNVLSNIQRHVNKETEREINKEREKHKDKHKEINKIKMQNEKIETILKNIELKMELKKAIKTNKLDKHQLKIFKDIVDK
jgi:hypothetical protein